MTLAYGNPVLLQEEPIERLPFFHVLPGSRTLAISTAGCNLACTFCEVWDMAQASPEEVFAYEMPPDRVLRLAQAGAVQSISYAFGEPVVFFEYMESIARRAREAGVLNLMHSAGYIADAPLRRVAPWLDGVNIDLKGFDTDFYRTVVGGSLEPVLRTLNTVRELGLHLEITTPVIPTLNDEPEQVAVLCRWIAAELGTDVPVHFSRFYPLYKLSGLPRTPASTLDRARRTAHDCGLQYVYVAKVAGHAGEDTHCPACGTLLVDRIGFVVDAIRLDSGRCPQCGHRVPGRWDS